MADTGVPSQDLAKPTVQVQRLWFDDQIAEKRYQLSRVKADVERFVQGTIKKMEADVIMLDREIAELMRKKDELEKFGSQEVIELKR